MAQVGQVPFIISGLNLNSNRKQVLTFDGKKYTEGLPEMKWKGGQVVE